MVVVVVKLIHYTCTVVVGAESDGMDLECTLREKELEMLEVEGM